MTPSDAVLPGQTSDEYPTRVLPLQRPEGEPKRYRLVADTHDQTGRPFHIGLCTHLHETPEAAQGCLEALANLKARTFASDDEKILDLMGDARSWLKGFERVKAQRRFASIDVTLLEGAAAQLFEAILKEFRR